MHAACCCATQHLRLCRRSRQASHLRVFKPMSKSCAGAVAPAPNRLSHTPMTCYGRPSFVATDLQVHFASDDQRLSLPSANAAVSPLLHDTLPQSVIASRTPPKAVDDLPDVLLQAICKQRQPAQSSSKLVFQFLTDLANLQIAHV